MRETVYAFNDNNVIATYDLDMDIWHPNRAKMASIICEILPFNKDDAPKILEMGIGTGYLSKKIITTFPGAHIVGVDAAEGMIGVSKIRLEDHLKQITFKISAFQELPLKEKYSSEFDAVVTSFALHHLYEEEKFILFQYILAALKPNGWFINGDIFRATDTVIEDKFRYIHYSGIRERIRSLKNQEKSLEQIAEEIAAKEKRDGDILLLLSDDLHIAKEAGFRMVDCVWKEYREAVYAAVK